MIKKLTKLSDAVLEHLVFSHQHLRLGLVEGAFVTHSQHPVTALLADGCGSEPW